MSVREASILHADLDSFYGRGRPAGYLVDEFEDRERIDADAEITKARREVGTRVVRTTGD